jgi:PAS domain S-box-containing protein
MHGNYIYVSPSVKYATGFSAEELLGKHVLDFLDTAEFSSFQHFKDALIGSKSKGRLLEHHVRTKDGKWRIIETSSRIIYDENSHPVNFISSSRLVEERKRAENAVINALKDAQEISNLKSKFISLVSHEMKTPMTSIYSGVEIMEIKARQGSQIDDAFYRQFDIIKSEVSRLNELVEKILFWGKVESGKIGNNREVIDAVNLLQGICNEYNRMQTDGRKMVMRIKGNPGSILIDPMHLRHIVGNLISNAFKYSKGKSEPELEIEFGEHNWKITVIDFGLGIPETEVTHLFKSFFRASNVEHINGNGLGMVVVKYFVEANEGLLKVESKENVGTKISIAFPCQ